MHCVLESDTESVINLLVLLVVLLASLATSDPRQRHVEAALHCCQT